MLVKILLKIVINNRVISVFMVVNNCKKIEDTIALWKIDFCVCGGWGNYCLKLFINNPVLSVCMVVNNCKNIENYVSALKDIF